ncbi:hypothetical protein FRB90_012489, partial [Tulasnella sp. 427]
FSGGLLAELCQGPSVQLDRLVLGPDTDHWGVRKTADGSFERFLSVTNRGRFEKLFDSTLGDINSNSQIAFVALGHNGDWVFGVNGQVEYRCVKPLQNKLRGSWKIRKHVSTVVLSPMSRTWIIVWDDGTLSHNLPPNIANVVNDYCQLHYSLKKVANGAKRKAPRVKSAGRNELSSLTASSPSAQQMTSTQAASPTPIESLLTAPPVVPISFPTSTKTAQPEPSAQPTSPILNPPSMPRDIVPSAAPSPTVPRPIQRTPSLQRVQPATPSVQSPVARSTAPTQPPPAFNTWQIPRATPAPPIARTTAPFGGVRRFRWLDDEEDDCWGESWADEEEDYCWGRSSSYYVSPPSPPKKMTTTLRLLDRDGFVDDYEYEKISGLFRDGWQHSGKVRPKVLRIFAVSLPDHLSESYESYKASLGRRHGWDGINERYLFHGTHRYCSVGERDNDTELCEHSICSFCSILRTSFSISKAGSAGRLFQRFGTGIYTSSVSSKADDYSNEHVYRETKAVIVARVALGKSSALHRDMVHLTAAPYGYGSALGEVGISLNHDEQVLYKDEAIRPAYVVVYEKPTPVVVASPPPRPAPTMNGSLGSGGVGMSLNHDEQVLYKDDAIRPAYVVVYERPTPIVARPPPKSAPKKNSPSSSGGFPIMETQRPLRRSDFLAHRTM